MSKISKPRNYKVIAFILTTLFSVIFFCQEIKLNESSQIISIRKEYDDLIVKSFQLNEEYNFILNKYPDVLFQDTDDVGFSDTDDVGFVKISEEDAKKLSFLKQRLSLLKENFQVYENKLSELEGREPRNINQLLPATNSN